MRKRYIGTAFFLSMTMGLSMLAGCGAAADGSQTASTTAVEKTASGSQDQSGQEAEKNIVYGIVDTVNEDGISIQTGTMKEPAGGPEGNGPMDGGSQKGSESDSSMDKPDQTGPSASDFLDLTGETQKITVTDDTVIEKISHPSGGTGGSGQNEPEGSGQNEPEGSSQNEPESSSQNETKSNNQEDPADNQPGQRPEEQTETASLSDLAEGTLVKVSLNDDGSAAKITIMDMSFGEGQGAPGGQSQAPIIYTAVRTFSENTETNGDTYESTGTDENAVLVDSGAKVSLTNPTISRKSQDSSGGDQASFYGVGAAALVTDGTAVIKGGTIDTDSAGGAGVFAYEKGTAYVADTKITTSQDTSGGIHVAGGGTLYAWDVTAVTNGQSAAAIRSDRGGGTMVVDGGSYTSNGVGSPAVYCTADITVNNAELTANGSEAVCIEGFNSLRLFDTNLTGNMSDDKQNDNTWNVILYQSMSGDSEEGNSTFEMSGGSLKAGNGGMFYTTNTESTFILNNVDITYADENDYFLRCTGNSNQRGWGQTGANGADCQFTAVSQKMEGDVLWDSISQLDFYITEGSSLTGAVKDDETNAGNGGSGYCSIYLTKDSSWTVTGDSSLTNLYSEGTILDAEGKTVTIKDSDGKVYVKGDSAYTITVENYSDQADITGASQGTSWSDYQIERPEGL